MSKPKKHFIVRIQILYTFELNSPGSLWGPSYWMVSHSVPVQNRASVFEEQHFYHLLRELLGCSVCVDSYSKFQKKHPYDIKSTSPHQLATLLHKVHNQINKRQGGEKKMIRWTYEENQRYYKQVSPKLWLHALIDMLLICAVQQIRKKQKFK